MRDAADILCQDLARKITGKRPSDSYFRAVTKLGEIEDQGRPLAERVRAATLDPERAKQLTLELLTTMTPDMELTMTWRPPSVPTTVCNAVVKSVQKSLSDVV